MGRKIAAAAAGAAAAVAGLRLIVQRGQRRNAFIKVMPCRAMQLSNLAQVATENMLTDEPLSCCSSSSSWWGWWAFCSCCHIPCLRSFVPPLCRVLSGVDFKALLFFAFFVFFCHFLTPLLSCSSLATLPEIYTAPSQLATPTASSNSSRTLQLAAVSCHLTLD